MGNNSFFLEPDGWILPCNAMEEVMGNLKEQSFRDIWNGERAEYVRQMVRGCHKNCWMISSVGQQMKKYIQKPELWILKHKLFKREIKI